MTNLRRLCAAVVLTFALTVAAFADCPVPGIMNGPPCASSAQPATDDLTAPVEAEISTAAESPSVDLPSLAEIALNALLLF